MSATVEDEPTGAESEPTGAESEPTVEDEPTGVDIDHSPTKLSATVAVGAGLIAAVSSAPFALLALPLGVGGVGMIAGGLLLRGNRTWVSMGAGTLFLSVVVAGGFGAPVEFLFVSTIATLLAWDLGQNAVSLGEQVGRHSRTRRNEVIHASFSTIVAMAAMALGYVTYTLSGGGRPVAALAMLLFGVVFLLWAIRT